MKHWVICAVWASGIFLGISMHSFYLRWQATPAAQDDVVVIDEPRVWAPYREEDIKPYCTPAPQSEQTDPQGVMLYCGGPPCHEGWPAEWCQIHKWPRPERPTEYGPGVDPGAGFFYQPKEFQ